MTKEQIKTYKEIKDGEYFKKTVSITESKIALGDASKNQDPEAYYFTGYFNTKNHPDSYGDVPANYNGQPVYDFSRFKDNPVYLLDHWNSGGKVMGSFVDFGEDEKGMYGTVKLMKEPESEAVKHAIKAILEGHLRANSIGGRWFHDDPSDKNKLTRAYIHEVSAVAVGADPEALNDIPKPKSKDDSHIDNSKQLPNSDKAKLTVLVDKIRNREEKQ